MSATILTTIADHPLTISIGWALIHFLWQAALVGVVTVAILACLRASSSQLRYAVACAGFAIMTLAPIATLSYLIVKSDPVNWQAQLQAAQELKHTDGRADFDVTIIPVETTNRPDASATEFELSKLLAGQGSRPAILSAGWLPTSKTYVGQIQPWLPLFVIVWLAGVVCLSCRLLTGLCRVWRWRREASVIAPGKLTAAAAKIAGRMNLRCSFRLLQSTRVTIPAVIGWIRPAVLVPASMVSGLTTAELESILAHELAHVRRHDWLANMLQTAVETVLFYHPAVWWLSSRIRAERENSCDDMAVSVCGDGVVLARALARMEEMRCRREQLSVAANGGSLLGRIRRIVGAEPVGAGPWWPAGWLVLGSLAVLVMGLWISSSSAEPTRPTKAWSPVAQDQSLEKQSAEGTGEGDSQFATRKTEIQKTDPKTGIKKRVFANIRVSTDRHNQSPHQTSLEMMYSNVMMYTFLPARIVKELHAQELGEIDFGNQPPVKPKPYQSIFVPKLNVKPDKAAPAPRQKTVHVHELNSPVDPGVVIAPYANDAVWIPGHLEFYGMNQTQQHRFKVVRIEKVDLGVGPKFGPVNALVLDDANSDFGVLGLNWTQRVRGEHGEGLWFGPDGTFYFTTGFDPASQDQPPRSVPKKSDDATDKMTVKSSGHNPGPARMDRPGVRVLASHTYDHSRRESTGYVQLRGANVPVDDGVEHDGIIVYETLLYDIVAVDAESRKTLWSIPWGKTDPFWRTVSIVELDRGGTTEKAVELYAFNERTRELIYDYVSLPKGEPLEPPVVAADDPSSVDTDNTTLKFQIVDKEGDQITRAAVGAFERGRSAAELIRHFAQAMPDERRLLSGSTTNMETIVSAENVNYLLVDRMDAGEVIFNLPEGSRMRAEFSGKEIEIQQREDGATVLVTGGKIELIDAVGVVRAWASPDGGAEQLAVDCRVANDEVVFTMKARRIVEDAEFPNPPVQVVMNVATGAPADEDDPPHGAIRYEILPGDPKNGKPMRMKMKWRYEMRRLAEEAAAETGLSIDELIYGKDDSNEPKSMPLPLPVVPPKAEPTPEPNLRDDKKPWGDLAHDSGLRSRLTLQTEKPAVGKPLLFKLEVKNFGDKPTKVDPQEYEPFRVLRVKNEAGKSAPFIGMTPQTSGQDQPLEPGQSLTLWENVDANTLFLLDAGRYKFFAEGGEWAAQAWWRDSNTLEIEIGPGQQTSLNRLLKNLGANLPDKWEVSNGMGLAEGWKGIFLTHVPTSLKRDATGIQVWFTDEKLPDDFQLGQGDQKQFVTQLGRSELGFMNVAARPKTPKIWPEYLEHIRTAADSALSFAQDNPSADDDQRADNSEADQRPWTARGQVADTDGAPIKGVTVRAHCGAGTLRETGSAVTGVDGRYELHFGPGVWFENKKTVQAATISVHLDGFFEKNLHRQGDLLAVYVLPDGEIGWGGKTVDDVFLPGKSKTIDFVMLPATKIQGVVVDQDGKRPEGLRVSITGEELPPSSSVVAEVKTSAEGEYEINNIPTGYNFQILVQPAVAEPPWLAWASPPLKFVNSDTGDTHLQYAIDGKPVDFSCQHLYLTVLGDGVSWKSALKEASERELKLTWDGLSTDNLVRAGIAYLELGDK